MKNGIFSFPQVEGKKVKVVIIRLENGEIVARTVEELEKMKERGVKYEVIQEQQ